MKIALAAALLLGVASARHILKEISGTYTMFDGFGMPNIIQIDGTYAADVAYSTSFDVDEDTTNAYDWVFGYGLNVDALGTYKMNFKIGDWVNYEVKGTATLFDITPYYQTVTVTRPDAKLYVPAAPYRVILGASYEVNALDFQITHTPDMKVMSVSIYDAVMNAIGGTFDINDFLPVDMTPSTGNWNWQQDSTLYIDDSYLQFNLLEYLGVQTTDFYFGEHDWFTPIAFTLLA